MLRWFLRLDWLILRATLVAFLEQADPSFGKLASTWQIGRCHFIVSRQRQVQIGSSANKECCRAVMLVQLAAWVR